jgi:hypothetical protein
MMEILVILNDPPYGDERSYIGLRVFLIGDAASRSAKRETEGATVSAQRSVDAR